MRFFSLARDESIATVLEAQQKGIASILAFCQGTQKRRLSTSRVWRRSVLKQPLEVIIVPVVLVGHFKGSLA